MNIKFNYIILLAIILAVVACKKDNYQAPGSTLSGRIMYKGDSVGVEYNQVPFNIYQSGFGKTGAITGTFAPDGSYSILTFDGNYRFTIPPAQGPFLWKELTASARDTVKITLNGSQTYNIEVTPYYMIRNLKTSVTPGVVTANFSVEQIITDPALAKSIQTVSLYINKTVFVSEGNNENIAKFDLAGSAITSLSNITLNVTVPTLSPTQNYVYARVGIKIAGVEDLMFSPLRKITLK